MTEYSSKNLPDKKITTFVVLDLETTGLDTQSDTIIEVAAIRFELRKNGLGSYEATNIVERSMLIDPERELSEEISLITHITGAMLKGKETWSNVRERVEEFIGDSVIVGHNVLFDVAMLQTHGIDLESHIILDTFELSELFSSESESLNLGFLGAKYGFKTDKGEHRALGDTEICLSLFLFYLETCRMLDSKTLSILKLVAQKEEKENIGYILSLLSLENKHEYVFDAERFSLDTKGWETEQKKEHHLSPVTRTLSIDPEKNGEITLLVEQIEQSEKTHILTTHPKISEDILSSLEEHGIYALLGMRRDKWCSLRYIQESINNDIVWERKLSILFGRILLWLEKTQTGIIDELKMYGKEYEYRNYFSIAHDEEHIFSKKYQKLEKLANVVIFDAYDYLKTYHDTPDSLILKDIGFFDDKIRRAKSHSIDIGELIKATHTLIQDKLLQEKIIGILSFIQYIYESIPKRPTGEQEFPPGNFGEVYFFDQAELWKKGGVWLAIANRHLIHYMSIVNVDHLVSSASREDWRRYKDNIDFITVYHQHTSSCTSIIIEIGIATTTLKFIPKSTQQYFEKLMKYGAKKNILSYGYGLGGQKVRDFLQREYGIDKIELSGSEQQRHFHTIDSLNSLNLTDGVILTTSMKHIRELGKFCEKSGRKVFMQGISGGKSKIQSLFQKETGEKVLIGLIDTWRDDAWLWKIVKNIVIAKLPFDPPSDPYFLARTVGMSNNFSLYSEPMVILRINLLIGRIRSSGYTGEIWCLDTRLETTPWGSDIKKELL